MNKKTAFSLTELMIVLLIASLIVAASIPVLTKKHFKMPSLLGHGVYLCFYENGKLKQLQSNSQFANPDNAQQVEDCIFTPPQKASFFQISAVGGGGGGGDSGYTGGHPYSGWTPMQEFPAVATSSAEVITEDFLKTKNILLSDFQKYSGTLHTYALGRGSGVPSSVMVVNTVERCVLLPKPECSEWKTDIQPVHLDAGQCIVSPGTSGATRHEVEVSHYEPVKVPLDSPIAVYTTGSVTYTNCQPVYTCIHKVDKTVTGCECQDETGNHWGFMENPCTYSNDTCTAGGHTGAHLVKNVNGTVQGECASPPPPNGNPADYTVSYPQNSTNCKPEGSYKDRIFQKEKWQLQKQKVVYYTAPCSNPPSSGYDNVEYEYCANWDTTNIGKTVNETDYKKTDPAHCGEIGYFYYNKQAENWNNGTNADWEPEDFLYDHKIKPFNPSVPKYVRNTNRFSVSIPYFCSTSTNKDGGTVTGDVGLYFRSPSFEKNPKGPYHYSSQGSSGENPSISAGLVNRGYGGANTPYHRLVEVKNTDGSDSYYFNNNIYYDGTSGTYDDAINGKDNDSIESRIASYHVAPYQGSYGRVYCLNNSYDENNSLNPTWLDGCGIDNKNSACYSLPNSSYSTNTLANVGGGSANYVRHYGDVFGCGQTGGRDNYGVEKKYWVYSDAMLLKHDDNGDNIISHIKGYNAWKGQPGLLRLKDKKRTQDYMDKLGSAFTYQGIYSNAYQGKFQIEVALEGLKLDPTLFGRVQNALHDKGIEVSNISDLVDKLYFYKWENNDYTIKEDRIYDESGDFTEAYKDYLAQGRDGLGVDNYNPQQDPNIKDILIEIYNQESIKTPWSGRGLCENGLRPGDDEAVQRHSMSNGFYWCRMYIYTGSDNDVYYHLANDEITNSRGYCLQHDINPKGSGYNKKGEGDTDKKTQINNVDYFMQPNQFANYRYRNSFDQNFLQYGNPGDAGEYKSMVIRSLKGMDTTIHIGRGGQAGNYKSGDPGTNGTATSMGTVVKAEGGKGGEGGLVAKAEVLPAFDQKQYWQEWLCKNTKNGEFSPPEPDDDMYSNYQDWKSGDQYELPNCATMAEWKHVITSGLIEGGQPALRGLAANLYNYVIPQLKDRISQKFDKFGKGGRGGGVEHMCWAGQNIVQFEYYNLSTSTCPHSGYFIDADGTRKKCSDYIDYGYKILPCDPFDSKNYKVYGGEDGKDGALMIRW